MIYREAPEEILFGQILSWIIDVINQKYKILSFLEEIFDMYRGCESEPNKNKIKKHLYFLRANLHEPWIQIILYLLRAPKLDFVAGLVLAFQDTDWI